MVCYYEIEKTRYDPNYDHTESATTHFSAGNVPLLKKNKKKKVNTVSFQISNWPCFLISFCSQRQQMLNKAVGENRKFPEIESVILICNSLEETLQGLYSSFVSGCPCGGRFICIFRGKMFFLSWK